MTVRDLLTALQTLPRMPELLAFEPGYEEYCEREIDEVESQGGRVYLHLGARVDDRRDQAPSVASRHGRPGSRRLPASWWAPPAPTVRP